MVTCCYGNEGGGEAKGGEDRSERWKFKKQKKETGRENDNKGVVKLKWRDSCETPGSLPHKQLATWRSVGSTPLRELEGMEGDSN